MDTSEQLNLAHRLTAQQLLIEWLLGNTAIQLAPGNPLAGLDAIARAFSSGLTSVRPEGLDPETANDTVHGLAVHLDMMFANTRDRLVRRASKPDDSGAA